MHFSPKPAALRRPAKRLSVESLEDRTTPSWGSIPPSSVAVPTSFASVTLNASGDASGNASITANETDWFRFTVPTGSATLSATTPSSNLDTVLGLYNSAGQRVAYNDDISSTNRDSRTTVSLSAGTYYLGVTNYTGTAGGSYTWAIDGPAAATDDAYENNDTSGTASDLGNLTATRNITGLRMADAADWFRFNTTTSGTGGGVAISFTHAQGDLDLRVFNAAGTQVGASEGTGNSESVSLSSLPAGTYFVQVFGYNGASNPNYSLTLTPPTPVSPPPPTTGGFAITLRVSGMTASQQAVFQQAANRWAQVITGDLPNATYQGIAVDDVLIDASGVPIDGVNGILGQAGPDSLRSGSRLPIHGIMEFDTADLAQLEAGGGLFSTIFHEMGHVLGIGTIWQSLGLVSGIGGSDPRFLGANARAAYNQIFNNTATSVPVENTGGPGTAGGHWRETVFGNEVMTGYLNNGANPLSRVTIGALQDMGYAVNYNAADAYTPPSGFNLVSGGGGGSSGGSFGLKAGPDVVWGGAGSFGGTQTERTGPPVTSRRPPRATDAGKPPVVTSQQPSVRESSPTTYTPSNIGGLFTFGDEV